MNTREKKFWDNLGTKDISRWRLKKIRYEKGFCICGQPIKNCYYITDGYYVKLIGSHCAKRLGVALSWRTKADYLVSAYLLAKNDFERDVIKSLQDKLPKWGSTLKISEKQKKVLERITKHKWRGFVWGMYYD